MQNKKDQFVNYKNNFIEKNEIIKSNKSNKPKKLNNNNEI